MSSLLNIVLASQDGVTLNTEGTYCDKNMKIVPLLEDKVVTPTSEEQNITPSEGYSGIGSVTVSAIPEGSGGADSSQFGWDGEDLTYTQWETKQMSELDIMAGYGVYNVNFTLTSSDAPHIESEYIKLAIGYGVDSTNTNNMPLSPVSIVAYKTETKKTMYAVPNLKNIKLTLTFKGGTDVKNTYLRYWLMVNTKLKSYNPPVITIINFTIDNEDYQAEEGMTWAEWCDSEYNTNNCMYDGYYANGTGIVNNMTNDTVLVDGASYTVTYYDFP